MELECKKSSPSTLFWFTSLNPSKANSRHVQLLSLSLDRPGCGVTDNLATERNANPYKKWQCKAAECNSNTVYWPISWKKIYWHITVSIQISEGVGLRTIWQAKIKGQTEAYSAIKKAILYRQNAMVNNTDRIIYR